MNKKCITQDPAIMANWVFTRLAILILMINTVSRYGSTGNPRYTINRLWQVL